MTLRGIVKGSIPKLPYNAGIYYFIQTIRLKRQLMKRLEAKETSLKTEKDSQRVYDAYDDREQKEYANGSSICLYKGRIAQMANREIRGLYLKYLFRELDKLISEKGRVKVLEVGCGNCINLVELKGRYGDQVQLYGIDISKKRIDVAKSYYSKKLDGIDLSQQSITERCKWADGFFDVVFSMHCLEQIAYNLSLALKEMYRLSSKGLILIEPVFENGNVAQRLYLLNSDHTRILLRTLRDLGYKIDRDEVLDIQANPLNQSTLLVIRK